MKNVKKLISLILVCCVVLTFASCGKNTEGEETTTTEAPVVNIVDDTVPAQETVGDTETAVVLPSETQSVQQTSVPVTQAPAVETQAPANAPEPQTQSQTQAPAVTAGVSKYTNNSLAVEQAVYYPNRILNENKKYPVVVWANGTGCSYSLYENLLMQIAEGGYIVVANGETMAADGTAQRESIDFIISENTNSNSVLNNKINTKKIAAAGHSQGGRSAVNAASADSRIACVYSLAGSNYDYEAEKLSAPAFFVTGTNDMIVSSSRWVKPAYDLCKGPAVYASLSGGVHTTCCTDPGKYSAYAVDWFDIYLKGDKSKKDIFRNGGKLSTDSAWVDFQSKGV